MISLRIADPVITGLIGKWLQAGVMAHGVVARPDAGTPQGGPISPGLANVYGRLFGRKGTVAFGLP
jgi:RNA-directed DNA polymerase